MGEILIVVLAVLWLARKQRKIMGALANLQTEVTALNTNANAVIDALKNRGISEADVQAQADAVHIVNTKLTDALATPPATS